MGKNHAERSFQETINLKTPRMPREHRRGTSGLIQELGGSSLENLHVAKSNSEF